MSSASVIPLSLFVFICLLVGVLLRRVCKQYGFPYTPLLLIFGLVWGMVIEYVGLLGESGELWHDIDPHVILIIFIPALIYESAGQTDFHVFRREIVSILLLAIPGVVVSTILTAIAFRFILRYEDIFGWSEALMLGAILSATDPVAVVALLKELGASKRLSTLIEGESLLNDGVAMCVFEVFYQISKGEDMGPGDVTILFLRLAFGGIALGLAFGIVMSTWIQYIFNDMISEVVLTFVTVYLVFWTAEGSGMHVSGILALVALGLYMSAWGKSYISTMSEKSNHSFWSIIAWMVETTLFVLSGVIIGFTSLINERIKASDWGMSICLFLLIIVIRGLSSLWFYPIMRKTGYGLDWRSYLVLIYGGLRGAIGLALALIVKHDDDVNEDVQHLVLFHTAMIVVLTLLVNGTTTGLLLNKLGLVKQSDTQEKILEDVVEAILEETEEKIQELKVGEHFQRVDWEKAKKLAGVDDFWNSCMASTTTGKRLMRRNSIKENGQDEFRKIYTTAHSTIQRDEMVTEFRHRLLTVLKGRVLASL